MQIGKIVTNGVALHAHETLTITFLAELGFNITLIPKDNRQGVHTPDIVMAGLRWEIKSPKGTGSSLMKNTLQRAARQSPNVIVDLRRARRHQTKCLTELKKEFQHSKTLRRLTIITKQKKVLDFEK